jgi:lipopolysaccharide/colanic/teichoic acid biosynthesis glycosyltransferase
MYPHLYKPLVDFIIALITSIILSPILLAVCILLLLTGEHQVFFRQPRLGLRNSKFKIWKYATMLKNSSQLGALSITVKNDPRVLPVGKILRKSKINEFPQIINVLTGDMSIVGPRPLVEETFDPYPDHVKAVIYKIKPGITGIGSIVFRHEERFFEKTNMTPNEFYASHIAPYKGDLEIWYQNHLSFRTDCIILFLTFWVLIVPESNLVYTVFKDLPAKPAELV